MIPGIVAGSLSKNLVIEGLVDLGLDKETGYYRFTDRKSMTYGPPALGQVPHLGNLRIWTATQVDSDIVISNSSSSHIAVSGISEQLNNLSLSFDQNGYPIIVWERNKRIFMNWYDPVISQTTTTDLGPGFAPFIALETFNDVLKPTRTIFLVYMDLNNNLVHRYQNDRWTEVFTIKSGVKDIIGFGPTDFNNIKIVYVNDKNVQGNFTIGFIATERLGLYEVDVLNAQKMGGDLQSISYSDSRHLADFLESSVVYTVANVTSMASVLQFSTENIELVETSPVYTITNASTGMTTSIKGYQRIYPVDTVGEVVIAGDMLSLNIKNAAIVVNASDYVGDVVITGQLQTLNVTVNNQTVYANLNPKTWNTFQRASTVVLDSTMKIASEMPSQDNVSGIVKSTSPFAISGIYYSEIVPNIVGAEKFAIGICISDANTDITVDDGKWIYWSDGVLESNNGSTLSAPVLSQSDAVQFVYNAADGGLWISVNGVYIHGNPDTNISPTWTLNPIGRYHTFALPTTGTNIFLSQSNVFYKESGGNTDVNINAEWVNVNSNTAITSLLPVINGNSVKMFPIGSPATSSNLGFGQQPVDYKSTKSITFKTKLNIVGTWYDNDFTDAGTQVYIFLNRTNNQLTFYPIDWCYNRPNTCYSAIPDHGNFLVIAFSRNSTNPIRFSTNYRNPVGSLTEGVSTDISYAISPPTDAFDGTKELKFVITPDDSAQNIKIEYFINEVKYGEGTVAYTATQKANGLVRGDGTLIASHWNYNHTTANSYVEYIDSSLTLKKYDNSNGIAARLFRLIIASRNPTGQTSGYINISMGLASTIGGDNICSDNGQLVADASVTSNSVYSGTAADGWRDKLRHSSASPFWHSRDSSAPWINTIDFGVGKSVYAKEFYIIPKNTLPDQRTPFDFVLQASHDGTNWFDVLSEKGVTGWALGQPKTWALNADFASNGKNVYSKLDSYYPFDVDTQDYRGKSPMLVSGAGNSFVPAVIANGSRNSSNITYSTVMPTAVTDSAYSCGGWIKPATLKTSQLIHGIEAPTPGTLSSELRLFSGNIRAAVFDTTNNEYAVLQPYTQYDLLNKFTHIVYTVNKTEISLYVNGRKVGSTPTGNVTFRTPTRLMLGDNQTNSFDSIFDEFFYSEPLSDSEISWMYNFGLGRSYTDIKNAANDPAYTATIIDVPVDGVDNSSIFMNRVTDAALSTNGAMRMTNNKAVFTGFGSTAFMYNTNIATSSFATNDFMIDFMINAKIGPESQNGYTLVDTYYTNNANSWQIYVNPNGTVSWYTGTGITLTSTKPLVTDVDTRLTIARKAGVMVLYINGVENGSINDNRPYAVANGIIYFGAQRHIANANYTLNGSLWNIRIFNGYGDFEGIKNVPYIDVKFDGNPRDIGYGRSVWTSGVTFGSTNPPPTSKQYAIINTSFQTTSNPYFNGLMNNSIIKNFYVEADVRFSGKTATSIHGIFSQYLNNDSSGNRWFLIYRAETSKLQLYRMDDVNTVFSSYDVDFNADPTKWYKIRLERKTNGHYSIIVDGITLGVDSTVLSYTSTHPFNIGYARSEGTNRGLLGDIANVKLFTNLPENGTASRVPTKVDISKVYTTEAFTIGYGVAVLNNEVYMTARTSNSSRIMKLDDGLEITGNAPLFTAYTGTTFYAGLREYNGSLVANVSNGGSGHIVGVSSDGITLNTGSNITASYSGYDIAIIDDRMVVGRSNGSSNGDAWSSVKYPLDLSGVVTYTTSSTGNSGTGQSCVKYKNMYYFSGSNTNKVSSVTTLNSTQTTTVHDTLTTTQVTGPTGGNALFNTLFTDNESLVFVTCRDAFSTTAPGNNNYSVFDGTVWTPKVLPTNCIFNMRQMAYVSENQTYYTVVLNTVTNVMEFYYWDKATKSLVASGSILPAPTEVLTGSTEMVYEGCTPWYGNVAYLFGRIREVGTNRVLTFVQKVSR